MWVMFRKNCGNSEGGKANASCQGTKAPSVLTMKTGIVVSMAVFYFGSGTKETKLQRYMYRVSSYDFEEKEMYHLVVLLSIVGGLQISPARHKRSK